ncbi:MAG: thioredoxin domain-containing protein [Desulfobacterales bacterium]
MATNRLAREKSPYLLQHAHNPVDWHAWNEEAFARARTENRPIFLSIGYATCHWCHVMERESFEDEEVARHLNRTFVCIKVDREERPDVDAVYMAACQLLSGAGGWPLTVFLTPERKPFFAATYVPKRARFGRPGLIELCERVDQLWRADPEKIRRMADDVHGALGVAFAFEGGQAPGMRLIDRALDDLRLAFDARHGGFEGAPKFPSPHRLQLLLRGYDRTREAWFLEAAVRTLHAMRLGGIWDHVGFGFHRYSTDARWFLPHFEKMLYDQAGIALAAAEAYQLTSDPLLARTVEETFAYVLRDMTSPEGAFFSAEDADSEGEEGRFYLWTLEEFRRVLGEAEARFWEPLFGLRAEGNFAAEATGRATGMNLLALGEPFSRRAKALGIAEEALWARWEEARRRLFTARRQRIAPLRDDKILTDWNGWMIAALAFGSRALGRPGWREAAERAAVFLRERLRAPDGGLLHRYRAGEAAVPGQAADYAFLIHGLLHLYRSSFRLEWLEEALALQERMLGELWDSAAGGFFLSADAGGELPVRPKEVYDGALPSANSIALLNLLWLARLTGRSEFAERADRLVAAFAGTIGRQPASFAAFLCGLDFALRPAEDLVITGGTTADELLEALDRSWAPNRVALFKNEENAARLARIAGFTGGLAVAGRATAHLCTGGSCRGEVSDLAAFLERLRTADGRR